MNIQGVAPNQGMSAMSGASPIAGGRFDGQFQGAMSDVASMLGTNVQQLGPMVNQAGSLSALASRSGVSDARLVDTIKQGLVDAGSKLTGNRLQNIASRIAHHHRLFASSQPSQSAISPSSWSATANNA